MAFLRFCRGWIVAALDRRASVASLIIADAFCTLRPDDVSHAQSGCSIVHFRVFPAQDTACHAVTVTKTVRSKPPFEVDLTRKTLQAAGALSQVGLHTSERLKSVQRPVDEFAKATERPTPECPECLDCPPPVKFSMADSPQSAGPSHHFRDGHPIRGGQHQQDRVFTSWRIRNHFPSLSLLLPFLALALAVSLDATLSPLPLHLIPWHVARPQQPEFPLLALGIGEVDLRADVMQTQPPCGALQRLELARLKPRRSVHHRLAAELAAQQRLEQSAAFGAVRDEVVSMPQLAHAK